MYDKYCLYILATPQGQLYIGITEDVEHTLGLHHYRKIGNTRRFKDIDLAEVLCVWRFEYFYAAGKFSRILRRALKKHPSLIKQLQNINRPDMIQLLKDLKYYNKDHSKVIS